MSYQPLKMKYEGIKPLILSNPNQDRNAPHVIELKELSAKRKKTDADLERIAYLQFVQSFYLDDKGNFVIPYLNIYYNLQNGAKLQKNGRKAKYAIAVEKSPLIEFDGLKDIDALFKSPIRYTHSQVTSNGKTIVTQPKFDKWALEVDIQYDEEVLNRSEIESAAMFAGRAHGLGAWRPLYGLFSVEFLT